jgi:prepilin-type N-terminal cleavage/methylation domain-containing protein
MRSSKNRGFTLIELLVVIAIIAILAAILFPVFTSAREAGKRALCIGNLKQVGTAMALYRDDYNGVNLGIWQSGVGDRGNFWHALTLYMKQRLGKDAKNIGKCPSAPWLKQEYSDVGGDKLNVGFAYQINETGWTDTTGGMRALCLAWPVKDSMIKRPAQLIHVGESMGWPIYGIAYQGSIVDNENPSSGVGWTSPMPDPNISIPLNGDQAGEHGGTKCLIYDVRVSHRGSACFLIYDGHVKAFAITTGRNWGNGR